MDNGLILNRYDKIVKLIKSVYIAGNRSRMSNDAAPAPALFKNLLIEINLFIEIWPKWPRKNNFQTIISVEIIISDQWV